MTQGGSPNLCRDEEPTNEACSDAQLSIAAHVAPRPSSSQRRHISKEDRQRLIRLNRAGSTCHGGRNGPSFRLSKRWAMIASQQVASQSQPFWGQCSMQPAAAGSGAGLVVRTAHLLDESASFPDVRLVSGSISHAFARLFCIFCLFRSFLHFAAFASVLGPS